MRLRTLTLPGAPGERPPYLLIIDDASDLHPDQAQHALDRNRLQGCSGVLVFGQEVHLGDDIPAKEIRAEVTPDQVVDAMVHDYGCETDHPAGTPCQTDVPGLPGVRPFGV